MARVPKVRGNLASLALPKTYEDCGETLRGPIERTGLTGRLGLVPFLLQWMMHGDERPCLEEIDGGWGLWSSRATADGEKY